MRRLLANQSETLERFEKLYDEAVKAHDVHRRKWTHWEKVYEGLTHPKPSRKNRKDHHVYPKWVFQQVETIKPRLIDPEPEFKYRPAEPRDQEHTSVLDKVVRYQLDQCGYVEDQPKFIHDAIVKGFAVGQVFWDYEERLIRKRRKPTLREAIAGKKGIDEIITPVRNWASIAYRDPNDIFPDPAATSDRDLRYLFDRSWLTKGQLQARVEEGIYDESAVKEACDRLGDADEGARPGESEEEAEARRQGKACIVTMWTPTRKLVVANRSVIVHDGPNPYDHGRIPFAFFSTQPRNTSLYGISEVETVEDIQRHLWAMRNMRITAVKMALKPMLILDPTIKGVQNISIQAGGKIYASPGQQVDQLRIDPNAGPGLDEEQMALGDMQTLTGASPFLAGADQSQFGINNETATGASIMQEEANKRMAAKKMQLRIFTAKLATMMAQLNYQYMDRNYAVRVAGAAGDSWVEVNPEDIPLVLDIRPVGLNESISKQTERNQKLELLNVLMPLNGMPVGGTRKVSLAGIVEDVVRSYDFDADRAFEDMSPQEAMMMQMQQAGLDPSMMMGPPEAGAPESASEMTGAINDEAAGF